MEEITVEKLCPEHLDDYLYFFEHVAHTDNPEWDRCYCLNYCGTDNLAQAGEFCDADVRRYHAVEYVKQGILKGYLAFDAEGAPVGWCNVNERDACLNCVGWKYLIAPEGELSTEPSKGRSVFCFTIAPHMRGKGVATALLERVIADAEKDGASYLEAYPNKEEADQYYSYVGPMGLYRKFGFTVHGETKWRWVLRKTL